MDVDTLDLRAFVRVARLGSFAAAARELRLSSTAISRRVNALEERLGTRLLLRTTRRVSLTTAGEEALTRSERMLADLQELQDTMTSSDDPCGHLRVTAGVSLGRALLHDALPGFLRSNPLVSVELLLTDKHVDLVDERIDLAIRIGSLSDASFVAQRLGYVAHIICGSPSVVHALGSHDAPSIAAASRIVDTNQPLTWRLTGPDGNLVEVAAKGRYAVNNAHAARDACCAGLGLAMLPSFVALPKIQNGQLAAVPGWSGPDLGLFAIVLKRRWTSAAVRALTAYIKDIAQHRF